jgi:hypothetical protein
LRAEALVLPLAEADFDFPALGLTFVFGFPAFAADLGRLAALGPAALAPDFERGVLAGLFSFLAGLVRARWIAVATTSIGYAIDRLQCSSAVIIDERRGHQCVGIDPALQYRRIVIRTQRLAARPHRGSALDRRTGSPSTQLDPPSAGLSLSILSSATACGPWKAVKMSRCVNQAQHAIGDDRHDNVIGAVRRAP